MKRENLIVKCALCSHVGISLNDQYIFATVYCLKVVRYGIFYVIITINGKAGCDMNVIVAYFKLRLLFQNF
jgi:hypothetical protein